MDKAQENYNRRLKVSKKRVKKVRKTFMPVNPTVLKDKLEIVKEYEGD